MASQFTDLGLYDRNWSPSDPQPFDGDYYAQDEVSRGVCLAGPSDFPGYSFGADGFHGILGDVDADFGVDFADKEASVLDDFSAEHAPPSLPSFALETTVCWVMLHSKVAPDPADIMNNVKCYMSDKENKQTRVTKVTPRKFTMKAKVFIGPSQCEVKARLFREQNSCYALEFQRRHGCSMCFYSFFQQINEHLRGQQLLDPARSPTRTNTPNTSVSLDDLSDVGDVETVAPYLDMAGLKDLPTCQAEAAAGLVQYLKTHSEQTVSAAVSEICEHFGRIEELVACPEEAASVHTAALIEELARHEEAREKLLGDGFLKLVQDRVHGSSSHLIRTEYQTLLDTLGFGTTTGAGSYKTSGGKEMRGGADKMNPMWADSLGQEFAGFDDLPEVAPPMPPSFR